MNEKQPTVQATCTIEQNGKEYSHCLRCGKKLKNPIARKIGYGPVCEQKMKIMDKRRLF